MIHYIYALVDPTSDVPFYVGETKDPNKRLAAHLAYATVVRRNPPPCQRYILSLKERGVKPILRVLETVDKHDARMRERHWIKALAADGCPITNAANTGAEKPMQLTQSMQSALVLAAKRDDGIVIAAYQGKGDIFPYTGVALAARGFFTELERQGTRYVFKVTEAGRNIVNTP